MVTSCVKCGTELSFADRINYNNRYMCPRCVYETAPPGSPVRTQIERNYAEHLEGR